MKGVGEDNAFEVIGLVKNNLPKWLSIELCLCRERKEDVFVFEITSQLVTALAVPLKDELICGGWNLRTNLLHVNWAETPIKEGFNEEDMESTFACHWAHAFETKIKEDLNLERD
ncbi:unnamed protein product [Dovyalis caffra]|uniref:Uncharacterized protein n=1 Tax=Dovyalis caffra TaxID=77055 RepID=A0AAV1RKY0_9ROSI|nr:unnamed protein product [Dovyalis caffra]